MNKLFFVSIVASMLSACASVPMGDDQQDAQLKTFVAPKGMAGVYIYRNESMGRSVKMDVSLDGQPIGQTVANVYLYKEVTPGKHTVMSVAENTDALEFEAKPGTLTYIWQEVKMGILYARNKLHLVSEADGKKGVQETSLAVTK